MNLLILTDQFPYGHGEQFFEAELPELARHIDDITLIPIRPALDNVRLREVPSSVSVRDDLTKQIVESVQELKQQPLRALLSTQESSILLRNIVRLGLRRRGAITSFWLHAHAIKNVLKQSGLLKDGTV
ncbi:hypothetical protein KKC44_02935, partial [Patescibacteria group bacterium]|nr:hypothetical protein [Patescibacteria group bacterium]